MDRKLDCLSILPVALISEMAAHWQDWIVCAIGIGVAGILIGRIVRLCRNRGAGSCASCDAAGCPLAGKRRRKKDRKI